MKIQIKSKKKIKMWFAILRNVMIEKGCAESKMSKKPT